MNSFALNAHNDIFLQGGRFARVTNGAYVVQAVRSRLLFYREEWFLDKTAGVPYFQSVFVKPANLGRVESLLKQEILQTNGVARLVSFSMEFNPTTRKLEVEFSAETTFGVIISDQVTINNG